jgi:16S rRNA A1518/A1519 N6-dimethyltransferase RsmA/KsgA/DIM1 with predicted DNA glycosylase/AP lyase activity
MPKFIGWVPTTDESVDEFFALAPVSAQDIVYDLGSGDGRLLIAAVEKGAGKAVGVEIEPEKVQASRDAIKAKKLEDKITVIEGDMMEVDLTDATIVLSYLYFNAVEALKPKLEKELKPGTRVIAETFPIPGWKPVRVVGDIYSWYSWQKFYLYIMPPEHTDVPPEYNSYILE